MTIMIIECAYFFGQEVAFGPNGECRGLIDGIQKMRDGGIQYNIMFYNDENMRVTDWYSEYELTTVSQCETSL